MSYLFDMKKANSYRFLHLLIVSILLFGFYSNSRGAEKLQGDQSSLTEKLKKMAEASRNKTPSEKRAIMEDSIEKIRASHLLKNALKVGEKMPQFSLPDFKKGMVSSADLLKDGPLIIVFYRGGWCPYCNLQLHDLQKHMNEINSAGAQLVAISPQTPDTSLSTAKKAGLSFYVLSDADNKVAKEFKLVFQLPEDLKKIYRDFGIDLEKSNGSISWELPLGATYIVRKDGIVSFAFLDADYKKRAETKDVISHLQKLKK